MHPQWRMQPSVTNKTFLNFKLNLNLTLKLNLNFSLQLRLHTVVNYKTWIYFNICAWSIAMNTLHPNIKLFEIFFNKEDLFSIITVEMNKALKKNIELFSLRSATSLHTNHFLWSTMTTLSIDVTMTTIVSWLCNKFNLQLRTVNSIFIQDWNLFALWIMWRTIICSQNSHQQLSHKS